ncbi:MAG: PAS domain S-box protein [bacterium]|nr:PAS domain S-box protein [bacterium]
MPTPATVFTTRSRVDPNLPLSGANEALAGMLGHSLDDLRGLTIPEISHPEDAARDSALFLELLAGKSTHYTIEKRLLHASGFFFPCFLTVWIAGRSDDRITCLATATDISEVKNLEEAMHSSEHFVSATSDHISFLGLDYRYVAVNDSYLRAHEMSREGIVGHTIAELLGPDTFNDLIKNNIDRCFQGETINYEAWFNFPAENRRCMAVTYVPSRDVDRKIVGAVVSSRDITEIRKLQTDLARFQKLEAIGRLSGTVAHDFNNLLMVISGATELARVGANKGKDIRVHLEEIDAAAVKASELTGHLRTFSRGQDLEFEELDVSRAVRDFVPLLRSSIGKSVEIQTSYPSRPMMARLGASQLEQVLLNLALNAQDAMLGGGTLSLTIEMVPLEPGEVGDSGGGKHVMVKIADTGDGMSPEVLERAFEPFFSTKEVGMGTGLGLASVYGIVKQSGGQVDVHSRVGEGTEFRIFFPALEEA